jgi:hypothetical protein
MLEAKSMGDPANEGLQLRLLILSDISQTDKDGGNARPT